MAQRMRFSFCTTVIVLTALACGQFQPATQTPVPSSALTLTFTPEPTLTLIPTRTRVPTVSHPPIDTGTFQRVVPLPEPIMNAYGEVQVRALVDNSVWVITSQSLAHWDGQVWDFVHSIEEDMLADVDENGWLWVLHQDADELAIWQNGQWTTFGADSGWTAAHASTAGWWVPKPWIVTLGKDRTVWLPTNRDVRYFDGQRWTIHTLQEMGFPPPEFEEMGIVHQIAILDDRNQVWVSECYYSGPGPMSGQGVRLFDGKTWSGEDAPPGPACVSVVYVDIAGNLWLGAKDVIWRYEPAHQTWTSYPLPESSLLGWNFTHPRDLIVDKSGDIWVILQYCGGASCDGIARLHRIHAGVWSQILESHDWVMPIKQLVLDDSVQGWLFWEEMVYQLIGDEIVLVANLEARGVSVSPDGKVWMVAGHEDNAALWVYEPPGEE